MSEAVTELMTQIEELSFAEQLKLMALLSVYCAKQVKGKGTIAKAAKKEKKAKNDDEEEEKPKAKKATPTGLLAYQAFAKHCRETYADRFEGLKGMKAISAVIKEIKEEDMEAYNLFVEKFKAKSAVAAEDADEDAAATEEVAEETAEESSVAVGGGGSSASVKKEVEKPQPAAVAVAAPAPAAVAKPKKPVKTVTGGAKAKASFETLEIQGEEYFHDAKTNKLFKKLEGGLSGNFVGTFQPDNEEEPIRYEDI